MGIEIPLYFSCGVNLCLFTTVLIVNKRHVAWGSIEKVRRVQMFSSLWH